jgi:hypothetical protein
VTFDVVGFSGFFIKTQANVLPVKLIAFSGYKDKNLHHLDWISATEQNSSHFEIEHSTDGTDFANLGRVAAAGNSSVKKDYAFEYAKYQHGTNYYRLKMIDQDGSFEYSNTISIKEDGTIASITAFPNPSETGIFTLQGKAFERTNAVVSNVLGQSINVIIQNNQLDLSELPAGVYFVRIAGENNTIRVVKS